MKQQMKKLNNAGIYIIINKLNNKKYIGKSVDILSRWKSHCRPSLTETHIDRAITKYGPENFDIDVLEVVDSNNENLDFILYQKEIYYVSLFNAKESDEFYNHSYGGDGFLGGEKHPNYGKFNYKHWQCKFYLIDDVGGIDFLRTEKSKGITLKKLGDKLGCSEDLILHYLRVHGFKNWDSLSYTRESAIGYKNHQCKWHIIDDAGGLDYLKKAVGDGKSLNVISSELKNISRHSIRRYLQFHNYNHFADFKHKVLSEFHEGLI